MPQTRRIDYIGDLKYGQGSIANVCNQRVKMFNICDVRKKYLAQLTIQIALLNEVINVMKLIMVMSAKNSSRERPFTELHPRTHDPQAVLPRSAIIDPVTITANRTGSSRSSSRVVADRMQPIRSKLTVTGKNRSGYGRTVVVHTVYIKLKTTYML